MVSDEVPELTVKMIAEWQINRVLQRYCRLVDDNNFDAIPELFTPDAVLNFGGRMLRGRSAIEAYFHQVHQHSRREPFGMHLLGNSIVDVGDRTARASSDFVQIWRIGEGAGEDARSVVAGVHRAEIPISGRYVDVLVPEQTAEHGWLLAERSAQLFAQHPFLHEA